MSTYIAKHLVLTRDADSQRREFQPGATLPADQFDARELADLVKIGAAESQPDPAPELSPTGMLATDTPPPPESPPADPPANAGGEGADAPDKPRKPK